jgi:hypothetical protein
MYEGVSRWGWDESLFCIEDVALKGPRGEPLCLAYKTSTYNAIASVYVRDDGYVLKIKGENGYYPLPEGDTLAAYQASGSLPKALPTYSLTFEDYLSGMTVWFVIAFFALLAMLNVWWDRRRARLQVASEPVQNDELEA